jgi:hypothetical protein
MNLATNDTCIVIPQPEREPTAEHASWLETRSRLRAALAASVAESLRLRDEALAVTGPARHELHLRRRQVGWRTRHILLALACHRGRPYARVEARTHDRLVNSQNIALRLAGVSRVPVMPGPERDAYDAAWRRVSAWLKA